MSWVRRGSASLSAVQYLDACSRGPQRLGLTSSSDQRYCALQKSELEHRDDIDAWSPRPVVGTAPGHLSRRLTELGPPAPVALARIRCRAFHPPAPFIGYLAPFQPLDAPPSSPTSYAVTTSPHHSTQQPPGGASKNQRLGSTSLVLHSRLVRVESGFKGCDVQVRRCSRGLSSASPTVPFCAQVHKMRSSFPTLYMSRS